MKYIIPVTVKIMLRVRLSNSPIFVKRNIKKGIKNRIIVHVVSKLIKSFPNLLMFLILPFLDVHNIKGTKIPSNGKNKNVRAERLR
jgi:hypothetical protein